MSHLSDTERRFAVKVLRLASEQFSNNGCNDLKVLNTPENHAFMQKMYAADECPPYDPEATHLWFMDWWVMSYLADRLEE